MAAQLGRDARLRGETCTVPTDARCRGWRWRCSWNWLGTALTPAQYAVDVTTGAVDLDGTAVVGQSAYVTVVGYLRRALVDLAYAGHASAPVTFAADLVRTVDAGATWTPIGTQSYPGTVAAGGGWVTVANLALLDLAVGQVVRFGVRAGAPAWRGDRLRRRPVQPARAGAQPRWNGVALLIAAPAARGAGRARWLHVVALALVAALVVVAGGGPGAGAGRRLVAQPARRVDARHRAGDPRWSPTPPGM